MRSILIELMHRDILLLALLAAIALALFLFTRDMAAKERALDARIAAEWFDKGEQQARAGEQDKAIASFRKATSIDHDNRMYLLALANALAAAGHRQEASQVLLGLREVSPEDAEINLQLARLAAKSGNEDEAVRYYHNAFFGLWTGEKADEERRNARVELIRFLLNDHQSSKALPEVLALAAEIPEDDEAGQAETGQLFLMAGDPQRALKHFARAIALNQYNAEALAGAGQASFQLADYTAASRYLETALAQGFNAEPERQLLAVAKLIQTNDPLAPHLTREDRNRRLLAAFDQATLRLQACLDRRPGQESSKSTSLESLKSDAVTMQARLQPSNLRRDPEMLPAGMELISKIEEATDAACGEPAGLDRALLLIGRKHRGALQ
ncbi:MAG: tetratricopeptide repeat protein [Terriglobales bacterium]